MEKTFLEWLYDKEEINATIRAVSTLEHIDEFLGADYGED